MGNTANRSYEYPTGSDGGNVPFVMQTLAEDIDADVQAIDERVVDLEAGLPYVVFRRSAAQTLTSGSETTIDLDSSPTVILGTWAESAGVITMPEDGIVAANLAGLFESGGTPSLYQVSITKNGTTGVVAILALNPSVLRSAALAALVHVAAGDTLRVRAFHNAGSNKTFGENGTAPLLVLKYLQLL